MLDRREVLRGALALGATGVVWTTQVHRLLGAEVSHAAGVGLSGTARAAIETLLRREARPTHRAELRRVNPEWDLLERMIGGLALACAGLRDPALEDRAGRALARLASQTDAEAREHGQAHFLLPYVHRFPFRGPQRSLFVDGEIALLLGASLMLRDGRARRQAFDARCERLQEILAAAPIGSGESYPDECWTYCNTTALAALRMAEVLRGRDTSSERAAFLAGAREHLIHEQTGLLTSAYTWKGRTVQPPEGSSLWWSTHALRLLDPELAREQYTRSVQALVRRRMGFAYALEWPDGVEQQVDVDSGGIVPGFGASPASSGLALVAARSFGDASLSRSLWASVELAAFPEVVDGAWRLRAGNPVGDAVAAYSLVQGPVWDQVGAT